MCHTNCPKKVVKMIDSSPKCNFSLISVNLFTIVKFRLQHYVICEAPQAELSGPGLDPPRPTRAGRCSQYRRLTVV